MIKVVSVEQMRALERGAEGLGLPGPALMENAGRAVADEIAARYPGQAFRHALVLVGPGNNGGDGLVVARHLHDDGYVVVVYLVNRAPVQDAKVDLLRQRGVTMLDLANDPGLAQLEVVHRTSDLIVDAILGTGRARPIGDGLADVLDRANRRDARQILVAVDLPTGVNADTGDVDPHALSADLTITLGQPKRGLLMGDAVDRVGELVIADIGIPDALSASIPTEYASTRSISALLPRRPRASHKGLFGRAIAVAGSALYTGAPVLTALGAERIGAGLVTLACPTTVRDSLAAHTLETTFLPLPDDGLRALTPAAVQPLVDILPTYDAMLVGPGIGRSPETAAFLDALLTQIHQSDTAVVFDADALTLLSEWPHWWERLPPRSILTPHPGEMARLVGHSLLADRIEQAEVVAGQWNAVVVAKGAYTVVAAPGRRTTVMPFANPALATAGTGDVLAGAILGFLAQRLPPDDAAVVGSFVHGCAGELLRRGVGPAGGLATDLARYLPEALDLIRGSPVDPL